MDFQDLLAPVAGHFDIDDALASWRWLVPESESLRPLVMTALGDLFVIRESGAVCFLDVMAGTYEEVSPSVDAWKATLHDESFVDRYFSPGFVVELREAGVTLSVGECYSPLHPPILGGAFTVENWKPTPWLVHIDHEGRAHEAIKDLPDGTQITKWNYTKL